MNHQDIRLGTQQQFERDLGKVKINLDYTVSRTRWRGASFINDDRDIVAVSTCLRRWDRRVTYSKKETLRPEERCTRPKRECTVTIKCLQNTALISR